MFYLCSLLATTISPLSIESQLIADCQFCNPELISPPEVYFKTCTYLPERCNNIWTGFDILIWRACVGGFSRSFGDVTIFETTSATTRTTTFYQTDKEIHFKWDLGFRASIGYEFALQGSDVGIYWTRFHQKTRTKQKSNRARWELDYDTVDALFSHRFWPDCCLDLQPKVALRYAQISQNLKIDLLTVYTTSSTTTNLTTLTRDTQKFWGLGPLFGIQADWYFWCGWSLFGRFDGGILYGHTRLNHTGEDSSSTVATFCNSTGSSCAAQVLLDLMFGIRWESQNVTLKADLEHHRYANFNQLGCSGDLNLFGGCVGIEIHY